MQEFLTARRLQVPVEVECSNLQEVQQVLDLLRQPGCCVTRIMLDNMAKYDSSLPGDHLAVLMSVDTWCGIVK